MSNNKRQGGEGALTPIKEDKELARYVSNGESKISMYFKQTQKGANVEVHVYSGVTDEEITDCVAKTKAAFKKGVIAKNEAIEELKEEGQIE